MLRGVRYVDRRSALGILASLAGGCTAQSPGGTRTESEGPTVSKTRTPSSTADFYVENTHFEESEIALRITHEDTTLVDDVFLVPESTGIRFENLGEFGTSYPVSATTKGEELTASGTWDVRSCADSEASKGNTDGGIQFLGDELRFRQNACDALFVGMMSSSYQDPDSHRV